MGGDSMNIKTLAKRQKERERHARLVLSFSLFA